MPRKSYVNMSKVTKKGTVYYRARLTFKYDEDLGRKPRPVDFYAKTMADADAKRKAYRPDSPSVDRKTAFSSWIEKEFLPAQAIKTEANNASYLGCKARENRFKRYLISTEIPALMRCSIRDTALGNLRPQMFNDYFAALEAAKISLDVRHQIKKDLRVAMKAARHKVPLELDAYFADVQLPSVKRKTREMFDIKFLTQVINDQTKPVEYRALLMALLTIQCRPSELFALSWSKIDFEGGGICLDAAMRGTADGYKPTPGTKTGAGRVVEVLRPLLGMFREIRKKNMASEFVFTTKEGRPINKDNFHRRVWPAIQKSLGLPTGPTFYSLKHLGNSFALAHGVTPEMQAAKMGHSTPRMALSTYRQILSVERSKALAVFDDSFPESVEHGLLPEIGGQN